MKVQSTAPLATSGSIELLEPSGAAIVDTRQPCVLQGGYNRWALAEPVTYSALPADLTIAGARFLAEVPVDNLSIEPPIVTTDEPVTITP